MSHSFPKSSMPVVTAKEVAARCGVSKSTVQRALSGPAHLVNPRTAALIRATATEMGYLPAYNDAARRLALRKHGKQALNHAIILFLPDIFSGSLYFQAVLRGIAGHLAAEHYDLLVRFVRFDGDDLLPESVLHGGADAAIVFPPEHLLDRLIDQLRGIPYFGDRPIVSLMKPVTGCSSVLTDDFHGGYLAAAHLFGLGHRHLLHFYDDHSRQRSYYAARRVAGYHQACTDHGLSPDHLQVVPANHRLSMVSRVSQALLTGLKTFPEVTAILAPNDTIALAIVNVLQQTGRQIPNRMSLIGYDDTEFLPDAQGANMLTTIALSLADVGREAAKIAIDLINGGISQNIQKTLPVELVVRGSTAPYMP